MTETHATLDAFGVAWRLGATLFFAALNGFFVAAEFALVKVRVSRIDQLAKSGLRPARTVQHILGHLDRYLSACQLGITLASLILGALGEPAVSVLLIAAARGMGIGVEEEPAWLPIVSIGIAFTLITTLHMTVGEQAPKMWALRRAEGTALKTGGILWAFAALFGPFIGLINGVSNAMLRAAGLPADHGHEGSHTAEEIRSILSLSASAGHITEKELEITENVFRLMNLEVRHILVPRVDTEFLTLDRSLEENLERIRSSSHSRLPLCDVGLDSIVGVVHTKDVLDATLRGEEPDLRALAREALFVADTMSLTNFLRELQSSFQHCAVVVDERGTAIGLSFREDALEEIVGPLGDEFDEFEPMFSQLEKGVFEIEGRTSLPEVCDRLEINLGEHEQEEEDTIGGHVTARLGRLPRKDDSVEVGHYRAKVLDVSRHRVQRLRFERIDEEEPREAATDEGD